jgi:hypothetical protein
MFVAFAASYLALGCVFALVGPAARGLRQEVASIAHEPTVPTWKRYAYGAILGASIAVAWPILVPAARRAERSERAWREAQPFESDPKQVAIAIGRLKSVPPRVLALDEYLRITEAFDIQTRIQVRQAMDEHGYLVAMATTQLGDPLPARVNVASSIGMPIVVTPSGPNAWSFTTSDESWENLAGCAGEAHVEDGVVVRVHVTVMN